MIRILIVEDRPEVRQGLQMRLCAEPDMQVVGQAGDGFAALALAEQLAPDVVLMDVEMPLQDGIETCKKLRQCHPQMQVVFLTIHDDALTRERAAQVRAAGFISKERPVDCLLSAIREVARISGNGNARASLSPK